MNKQALTQLLLPSLALIPMLLLLLLAPKDGWTEGTYTATGRYVETLSGQHMLYRNTDTGTHRYVLLLPEDQSTKEALEAFTTGDAIRVKTAPRLEELENGLCWTDVREPKKVRNHASIPDLTEEDLAYMESLAANFIPTS